MNEVFTAGILTISDKASAGKRQDSSGKVAARMLEKEGFSVVKQMIVPDSIDRIRDTLLEWVDRERLALIVTSGGTGLSPTDVTPQAMKKVIDYQVPGIAESMRAASLKKTPHAMLSRAMAGVRGSSLIINLPGSPGGVEDNLAVVLPALKHALSKLAGDTSECAPPPQA
ncbi:MAG: MogA/MoaB family molybdenum cofactor biosynthesis protein [Deltaproteobacteria bacterium]|nr:MogA/MoaB family molybdenum cofactor biosynthesis protein [Deltaproteobacteria bacterium]MBW1919476.1 MogA/MoaB family molybdenum cofactor biosynthesis protein [Deltaproteobacteria bacterium]